MAGPYDLTGQNIENTYQRILQTPNGTTFYDGTGSLVTITATAVAGGSNTQIQFNSASLLSGSSNFSFDYINNSVILTGSLDFNAAANAITNQAGRLHWNDTDGTLELGLKGGIVSSLLGQGLVSRVVNKTVPNIDLSGSNYQVVVVAGAQGQRLAVKLAQADVDANSAGTLGVVAENINKNQEGFIVTVGLLKNRDTTGALQGETWNDGDVLYLSPTTAGAITNIKPQAPQHTVIIGYVEYAHQNNGKIYIKIDNGYELDELHNVRITTSSLSTGDLLIYDSGSRLWKNSHTLSGSYILSGSLTTNDGLFTQTITSSFISASGGITGSLFGTSSWANNSITSSYPISVTGNNTIYSVLPLLTSTGNNNAIFLGPSAGGGVTTTYNSNFIGYGAGLSATTAYQSNFIGVYAGAEATKADDSNFIGLFAGYKAVSASFSTLIGWQAGYTNDPLTSIGSNNIIIGTNITLPSKSRDSINLGGIIFATGSYSNIGSLPSSGSQYNIGRVGINKVTPIYTLDVSGSGNYSNGLTVTGSLIAPTITGSLQGTASWAQSASVAISSSYTLSSSYAITASHALNIPTPGGFNDGSIQFNSGSKFGGDSILKYTYTPGSSNYKLSLSPNSDFIGTPYSAGNPSSLIIQNDPSSSRVYPSITSFSTTINANDSKGAIINFIAKTSSVYEKLFINGFKCDYSLFCSDGTSYQGSRVGTLMCSLNNDNTMAINIVDSNITGDTLLNLSSAIFYAEWNGDNVNLEIDILNINYNVYFTGLFTFFNSKIP